MKIEHFFLLAQPSCTSVKGRKEIAVEAVGRHQSKEGVGMEGGKDG